MQPPEVATLFVKRGVTWRAVFAWTDANGTPVPLPGTAARMQIRKWATDPAVLLELTTDAGGGLTREPGGVVGELHLYAGATKTALLPIGDAVADIRLYNPATPEEVVDLVEVLIRVREAVTK